MSATMSSLLVVAEQNGRHRVSHALDAERREVDPTKSPEDAAKSQGLDIPAGTSLKDLERAAVKKALEQHRGNRTRAAKTLGISVRTLQRKLKAWRAPVFALQHHSAHHDFSSPILQ